MSYYNYTNTDYTDNTGIVTEVVVHIIRIHSQANLICVIVNIIFMHDVIAQLFYLQQQNGYCQHNTSSYMCTFSVGVVVEDNTPYNFYVIHSYTICGPLVQLCTTLNSLIVAPTAAGCILGKITVPSWVTNMDCLSTNARTHTTLVFLKLHLLLYQYCFCCLHLKGKWLFGSNLYQLKVL